MLWFLLIVPSVWLLRNDDIEWRIIVGLIGAVVFGAVASMVGSAFDYSYEYTGRINLATVRNMNGISGDFTLGSGYISSKPYYFYYSKQDGSEGMRPGSIPADNITIFQDDTTPRIDIYKSYATTPWSPWIGFPVNNGDKQYIIHVPPGTIQPGFRM